jgi:hypothetical protein
MSTLALWGLVSAVVTLVTYRALDARGRARWFEVGGRSHAPSGPYRSAVVHSARLVVAPSSVRTATVVSVVFLLGAAPAVYTVLDTPHFDGIAVPLLPGLLLSLASALCVSALLARASDEASHAARLTGRTSLFFHGGLSVLALAHLIVVETDWGSQVHACSRSLALGVLALALGATAQSLAVVRAAAASEAVRVPAPR